MDVKKAKERYVSLLCVLIFLICPIKVAALDDAYLPNETQTIAYQENHKNVIPIVLSADNNYGPMMYITMASILKNSNEDTYYDFYLLVTSDFEKKYQNLILTLETQYKCQINFVDMGTAFADTLKLEGNFPPSAYYRLLAADLLPHHAKCIYLDVDIIVRHDLTELFNTDLDGFYVAGVKDVPMAVNEAKYLSSINIREADKYINSGVLVMNLELMRRDNLVEKFIATVNYGIDGRRAFKSPDQDTINLVCDGRIKFLDLKFNIFPYIAEPALIHETERIKYENFFEKQQLEDACSDPVVVHFVGFRPWQDPLTVFAGEWWELCRVTPFYEEILYKCILKSVIVIQRKRSKLNYCRCKALSKLTFGKKRAHYERKCKEIKKVLEIR